MAIDKSNGAKVGRWGRKFVFPFSETQPRARTMKLIHRAANGKMNDIQSFSVEGISETDWKGVIDEIATAIIDDADGAQGTQSYVLNAMDAEGAILGRISLRQTAETDDDDDSVSSEPATSKGLLAQLMRHTEALHRNQTLAFAGIIRGQQAMLEQQGAMLEKFGQRHMELVEQRETLASQQNERELQAAETQASIEQRSMIVQRFVGLLGPIAKRFGLAAADNDLPIEVHELRDFLGTLGEDELERLKMALPPDKVILLMSLMEKNAAREEEIKPANGQVLDVQHQ
jgi:hypothetical protein